MPVDPAASAASLAVPDHQPNAAAASGTDAVLTAPAAGPYPGKGLGLITFAVLYTSL